MEYPKAIVWVRSVQLAEGVLVLVRSMPRREWHPMRDQLARAATSIPSNIAEGWIRETFREKVQFLAVAHGSLAELHTQLLICRRVGLLPADGVEHALALGDEVGRMLTVLKRRWRPLRNPRPCPGTPRRESDKS
jgi:four helix bundle protein